MKNLALAVLLPALIVTSAPATAYQPFTTDDTGTQGSGANQIEVSMARDRSAAPEGSEDLRTLPVVYARGISDQIDLYVGAQHRRLAISGAAGEASGLGSVAIGMKWRLLEYASAGISFAVKPEIHVALSSQRALRLGEPETSGNFALILTKEAGFGAVHLNIGASAEGYSESAGEAKTTGIQASVAPIWDCGIDWKVGFEVGTSLARSQGVTRRSDLVGLGVVHSPNRNLDIAVGVSRNISRTSPHTTTNSATAGISWRFQ